MKIKQVSYQLLSNNLWWIAPVIIVVPISIATQNLISPTAAYVGTTGIWNLIEELLDHL